MQGCSSFHNWIGRDPASDRSVESVTSYAHQLTISFKKIIQDDAQIDNSELLLIFTMCSNNPENHPLEECECDQLEFLDIIPDDIKAVLASVILHRLVVREDQNQTEQQVMSLFDEIAIP